MCCWHVFKMNLYFQRAIDLNSSIFLFYLHTFVLSTRLKWFPNHCILIENGVRSLCVYKLTLIFRCPAFIPELNKNFLSIYHLLYSFQSCHIKLVNKSVIFYSKKGKGFRWSLTGPYYKSRGGNEKSSGHQYLSSQLVSGWAIFAAQIGFNSTPLWSSLNEERRPLSCGKYFIWDSFYNFRAL